MAKNVCWVHPTHCILKGFTRLRASGDALAFVFVVFDVGRVVAPRVVKKTGLTVTSAWPTTTCSSTAPEQRLRGQIPHSTNKEKGTAEAQSL